MKKNFVMYLSFVLVFCVSGFAAVTWQPAAAATSWDTASAWSSGAVPGAAETVEITSVYSCELNTASAALKELNMGNGSTAVLNVNSGGTLNMGGGGYVNIGRRGHSEINVYAGGAMMLTSGARINMSWTADSIINQYGGTVKPSVLLSIGPNSTYNISGGLLDISDGDNTAVKVGNNNPLVDAEMNISGTGEVAVSGNCYFWAGVDSRSPSTGTVNQSGGYLNLSTCNKELLLGVDAGTSGIYNLTDGDVDVNTHLIIGNNGYGEFNQAGGTTDVDGYVLVGKYADSSGKMTLSGGTFNTTGGAMYVGNTGTGELEVSGGTFNCSDSLRLGRFEDAQGYLTISGGSVNIGGYLQAADPIVGATDPNQHAEITVLGSGASNITVGGRLDLRDKESTKLNFRFDENGITPISCGDHAPIEGTEITFAEVEGAALVVGQQFDAIVTATGFTVVVDATNVYVDESDVYDFSYEVVALAGGGEALRFTVTDINYPDCASAVAAGVTLPADFNLDCVVDLADFAEMAANWMVCNDPSGTNCQ